MGYLSQNVQYLIIVLSQCRHLEYTALPAGACCFTEVVGHSNLETVGVEISSYFSSHRTVCLKEKSASIKFPALSETCIKEKTNLILFSIILVGMVFNFLMIWNMLPKCQTADFD